MSEPITIEAIIRAPREKVWRYYSEPEHIVRWNSPSEDWHSLRATNDLQIGGRFNTRMEAKDGSAGFDFAGVYDDVVPNEKIAYTLDDGRKAVVAFADEGESTKIIIVFDPENQNPIEMQRDGWQAILNNFTEYVESN